MDDKCGGGGGGSSAGFSELPGFDESELTGDDADILTYGLDELDDVDVVPYCTIKMFIGDTKEEVGKKGSLSSQGFNPATRRTLLRGFSLD